MVEIAVEAFARAGITAKPTFMPWARILKVSEKAECAILGIWRNAERDRLYQYSQSILKQELGFFGLRSDNHDLNDPKVMASLVIGIQRGTYLSPSLVDKGYHFEETTDLQGSLLKLGKRRLDLVFGNRDAGQRMIQSQGELASIEWKKPGLEAKDSYLAFVNNYPGQDALIKAFDKGLNSMRIDGSLKRILQNAGISQ
ncbi:substrate-binding periplasmic protein [Rhodoferax aquaticus]|nr:transporter substrate-binding domain-containing protein [Rhodoferax aquaticus]